jgi:hypothetical protein
MMATVHAVARYTFWDLEGSPVCHRCRAWSDDVTVSLGMTPAVAQQSCAVAQKHKMWSEEDEEECDASTEAGSSQSDEKLLSTAGDGDFVEDLPHVPSMPPGVHLSSSALSLTMPPGVHVTHLPNQEAKTTLKLLNLPTNTSRDDVVDLLSQQGFQAGLHFDFLYVQRGLERKADVGQALINLCTPALADSMLQQLQGFHAWSCGNVLEVLWNAEQGQSRLIERFRNSRVMHRLVSDICKPVLFSHHGDRVDFPKPTRRIRHPLVGR